MALYVPATPHLLLLSPHPLLPSALSGPPHMPILQPGVPSLNFLNQANSYLYFKTILSFVTEQMGRPGGRVRPASSAATAVLGGQGQPLIQSQRLCNLVLATGGTDSQGVGRPDGMSVTPRGKRLGIWTRRAGPDLPLSRLWDLEGVLPSLREIKSRHKGSTKLLLTPEPAPADEYTCVGRCVKQDSEGESLVGRPTTYLKTLGWLCLGGPPCPDKHTPVIRISRAPGWATGLGPPPPPPQHCKPLVTTHRREPSISGEIRALPRRVGLWLWARVLSPLVAPDKRSFQLIPATAFLPELPLACSGQISTEQAFVNSQLSCFLLAGRG